MRILTFDIEDWFHILNHNSTKTHEQWESFESRIHENTDRILTLLDEAGLKATFFCLGWVAEKYPEVIKEIDNRGFEIGSHTYMHQLLYDQSRAEFGEDLKASIQVLEDITGKKVKSFRAPGFSLTSDALWVFDELIKHGIEYDSSIFPARRSHGGISSFSERTPHIISYNGVEIKEFPINTKRLMSRKFVFSGGGYFRLTPYWLLKKWTSQSEYVMTYFHPREFDPKQPVIKDLPLIRTFKSYYGLNGAMPKLKKYMDDFDFVDLSEASAAIDWAKVAKVQVE